uniref:Rabphilin n=2 Tax=Strongyloides stercoralis TaxID=6248 RepID=A0AAF5D5D0_STRER
MAKELIFGKVDDKIVTVDGFKIKVKNTIHDIVGYLLYKFTTMVSFFKRNIYFIKHLYIILYLNDIKEKNNNKMGELNQDLLPRMPLLFSTSNSFTSKDSMSKSPTPTFSFSATPNNEKKIFDDAYSTNHHRMSPSLLENQDSYHQPLRPPSTLSDLMNDWEIGGTQNAWVCPSDRHLQLRAQLKSGWSVRTAKIKSPTSSKAQPSGITEEEQEQIKRVLERAEQGRVNEQIRIGKMVERLENLKARATGNGVTQCLLCSAEFGLFTSKSYAAMCNDCRKYVCQRSCGVDTFDQKKMEPIFLCKVCSEYREVMLKKSGAWFYKELPTFVRSSPSVEEQEPSFLKYTNKTNDLNKRKLQSPSSCINNNGRMDKNSFQNKGNKQFSQTSESIIGSIPNFVKDNPYRPRIQPSWIKEKPVGNSSFNSEATHTSSDSEPDERQGYLKKISRRQYRPKDFLQKQSYIPDSLSQNLSTIGKHSKGGINKGKNQHRTYDSDDSDNDYCHHSTPSTSPRLSLATPSSFGGDDFSQNPTTIVSNDYPLDTKSIDSGGEPSIVQSDHSNHQSNTLSSSISGAEFQRFTSPSISQNELRHSNSSIRKESYNSPERRNSKGSSYPIVTLPQQSDNGTYILPSLTNNLQQTNYSYKCSSSPKTSISYGGNGIPKYSYNFQQRSLSATPGRQSPKNYFNNCNNNNNQNTIPTIPPRPPSTPSINLTYANNIRSSSTSSSTSSLSQRTCNEGNTFFDNILSSNNNSLFTLDPVIEVKGSSAVTPNDIPSSIEEIAKENATTPVFMSDQEGEDIPKISQNKARFGIEAIGDVLSQRPRLPVSHSVFSLKSHGVSFSQEGAEKMLENFRDTSNAYIGCFCLPRNIFKRNKKHKNFFYLKENDNEYLKKDVLGSVQFELTYYAKEKKLVIHLISARNLKAMDSNGFSDPYVKFHLIPGNIKATKLTSKTIEKTLNPNWDEELVYYGVTEKEKQIKTLRITVLDRDRIGSDFLGEVRVLLRKLPNGVTQKFNLYLDSAMRSNALHEMTTEPLIRGKILIAICYNFSQGSLIVNIKRCSELIGMDSSGFSDPYCKITLTPVTNKNHRKKTSVKKKTLNPEFDETFNFVIPYKDLPTKALVVKVYDHDVAKHDDYIGGIVLSTAAEGERGLQWKNCLENANQFFEQWHELEKED